MKTQLIPSWFAVLALIGTLSFGMQSLAEEAPASQQEIQTETETVKDHADGKSCNHEKMADCDCKKKHKGMKHKKSHKKS